MGVLVYGGYILFGGLIGFLSGIFGVGGSSIATPMLKLLFSVPDLAALASPLPVTVPTAAASAYSYWRKGLVRTDVALWAILGGMPGVIVGALGTRVVTGPWLMGLTGAFVVAVGLRLVVRTARENGRAKPDGRRASVHAALIGLVVGVLSGLLANGGGFLLVPAFVVLLGMTMQEAAATSLVCVAFYAVPGTLVHWWLGNINWLLVLCLSLGVMPAGYLGAKVGLRVAGTHARTAFGGFLTAFGIDFMLVQAGVRPAITYSLLAVAVAGAAGWTVLGLRKHAAGDASVAVHSGGITR